MPTSSNGWSASPDLAIRPLLIDGEPFVPGIRDDDDVFTVLQYVAQQLHERVEPIVRPDWHQQDDWGFSFRPNVNSPDDLSNHSSGTAFDYNATRHPNGVEASAGYTAEQIGTIRSILAEVDNAVRWGGDFNGTPDAMHFEVNVSAAELAIVAARLREPEDDMPAPKDWDAEDWAAVVKNVAPAIAKAVWSYVVRPASDTKNRPAVTEQTAQAALKKAANG